MNPKDSMHDNITAFVEEFKELFGYFWLVLLSVWGGTVNYLMRMKKDNKPLFSLTELIGEWAISGFAGLLTAFACVEMGMSWQMTAFFTGVSGHLGGRAIYLMEAYAQEKVKFLVGGTEKRND
jgi:hypothetical protein